MKFSEQWLREWVDPELSTEALAHQLTMAGLEVDAVEPVAPEFSGIVVGYVMTVGPHPDADRLRVCSVDVGEDAPLTIVCGAPNVEIGMRVPTALVGAKLPGGHKITKSKLRGVASFGMLCSTAELGMAEQADGLLPLPSDAEIGANVRDVLGLDDVSIELGLTPNRGDCLGIAGIARETGVLNRCAVTEPTIEAVMPATDRVVDVTIDAAEDCGHYVGRVISGVNPTAKTPLWMQERLRRSGVRSISAVVDITHYVLLELGQPMHAFDLDKLQGGIVVRRAQDKEKIILLDDQEITLSTSDVVIADHQQAVALAGIMGGAATAVSDETTSILFESAYFDPTRIAGRARGHGLHTDSSHRFERGVSPELQVKAIERATALLMQITGGEPGPLIEVTQSKGLPARNPILLRADRLRRLLGIEVADSDVTDMLSRLGMTVELSDGEWKATPPAHRFDMALEVDLIEEVARIYGYDEIAPSDSAASLILRNEPEGVAESDRVTDLLVDRGYQEAITYSFVDPKTQKLFSPSLTPVALSNPISADLSVMRTSLWVGLTQALVYNLNRQQSRVFLFETGLRFIPQGNDIKQEKMISGIATGVTIPEQWGTDPRAVDFYDIKADVEALLDLAGGGDQFRFEAAEHAALHPGQSARIMHGERVIGWLGKLHPGLQKPLDTPAAVYLFELEAAALSTGNIPAFTPLSRFPTIRRDIAISVDEATDWQMVKDCVISAVPATLKEVIIFDDYRGKEVETGRKSLALGLILQDYSRTLVDQDVDGIVSDALAALGKELGASLRE